MKKKTTLFKSALSILILLWMFSAQAQTLSLSEDFSTTTWFESGDLIRNVVADRLESTIAVRGFDDGAGVQSRDIDPGDGRHGSFNSSTWVNFDNDGDISDNFIRIDTSVHRDLQFTDFTLANGITIRPVGDNPLIIRTLSDMTIDGVIDCSGTDGEDLNADDSVVSSGGTGVCGGGDGGNGGTITVAPQNGESLSTNITFGGAGPNGNPADGNGGGGGGSFTETGGTRDADPGEDSAGGPGGSAGTLFADNTFLELVGGAGGGGGSVHNTAGVGDSSGGAGGGGGGVIYLVALGDILVNATAQILASGGDGGSDGGALQAGGGGGGGGGGILAFAFGDIFLDGASTVTALEGAAGTTLFANSDGGKGGRGRTWFTDNDGVPSGAGSENPGTRLVTPGFIFYAAGTRTATSIAFDTMNSRPLILSSVETATEAAGSTVNVLVSMGDTPDFTPVLWQDVNSVTQSSKRYIRYQVAISQAALNNPSFLSALTLSYQPYEEEDFEFTGGCGLVSGSGGSSYLTVLLLLLSTLLLPLLLKPYSYH